MNNIEDRITSNSRVCKYFDKKILNDKKIRDVLIAFEEILIIKKNIKNMYNINEFDEIKMLIGKKINNLVVTNKDLNYVLLVSRTYQKLYDKCKKMLEERV